MASATSAPAPETLTLNRPPLHLSMSEMDEYIQHGLDLSYMSEPPPSDTPSDLTFMDEFLNLSDRAITALAISSLPSSGKRSERLLHCELFRCYHSCGEHTWGQRSSRCELTIACLGCASRAAEEQFDKYVHLELQAAAGYTLFTFPAPSDDVTPKEYTSALGRTLTRTLDKAPALSKIKVLSGRVEVMYLGTATLDQLRTLQSLYPGFRYQSAGAGNFQRDLHELLAPELPSDPVQLGELDYKYRRVRQLRVSGMSREERKKLSVCTTSNTDNFPTKDDDGTPICPKCRAKAIKSTEWTASNLPISKLRWVLRVPIPPLVM